MDALITQQTAPEEAYRKLDDLANKHCEILRKATKQVQEARLNHDDIAVKRAVTDYDEALKRYVPVLMSQAKIYWDLGNYVQVEKLFRMSSDFCNDHDIWRLNVAHTLFMQKNKYTEATSFYELIVNKNYDKVSIKYMMNLIIIFTNYFYLLDIRCKCHCSCKFMRQLHNDKSKWSGRGINEKN